MKPARRMGILCYAHDGEGQVPTKSTKMKKGHVCFIYQTCDKQGRDIIG